MYTDKYVCKKKYIHIYLSLRSSWGVMGVMGLPAVKDMEVSGKPNPYSPSYSGKTLEEPSVILNARR